jgi:hypothetical protein
MTRAGAAGAEGAPRRPVLAGPRIVLRPGALTRVGPLGCRAERAG